MESVTMLPDMLDDAEDVNTFDISDIGNDDLPQVVTDLSNTQEVRIDALERYCEYLPEEAINLFSIFTGMYQFSGVSILQDFLYHICTHGQMSPFLRLEAAQSLLTYEEDEYYEENDEEVQDPEAVSRNKQRLQLGYKALDHVCYDLTDPTPRRVEAICTLMESPDHKIVSNSYFREFVNDQVIDCDYRYKCILSLENKHAILEREFFIEKACIEFLFCEQNNMRYRILAAQNLMQTGRLDTKKIDRVCTTILSFAKNETLEHNLRSDAADMILGIAPEEMKIEGRKIINELASAYGHVRTLFDNAQNVHTAEIDKSLTEGLMALSDIPIMEIDKKFITFDYVHKQVMELVAITRINSDGGCKACGKEVDTDTCSTPCSENWMCNISLNRIGMDRFRYSNLNYTLSHILLRVWSFIQCNEYRETLERRLIEELCDMCGTCSTGFASRLVNVMSGFGDFNMHVSWGDQITANFTGRLNAFARRIEEPDSIFRTEKLNEVIELWLNQHPDIRDGLEVNQKYVKEIERRKIDQAERVIDARRFATAKRERMLNGDYTDLDDMRSPAGPSESLMTSEGLMKAMVEEYRTSEGADVRVDKCLEDFAENVIGEMTVVTSDWKSRPHFLLFFGSVMLRIREEMYQEFNEHITDTDYDLYFRVAISTYEGEV